MVDWLLSCNKHSDSSSFPLCVGKQGKNASFMDTLVVTTSKGKTEMEEHEEN